MRTLLLASLLLASCAGSVDMKPDGSVKVLGPVMARSDRMAVNVKTQIGEMRVLIVNGNSEAVPNHVIDAVMAGIAAKGVVKVDQQQNPIP